MAERLVLTAFGELRPIAFPPAAALRRSECHVENEQRVITRAAKVAVPGRALLLPLGRALGTVHVEDDAVRRPPPMHPVGSRRRTGP